MGERPAPQTCFRSVAVRPLIDCAAKVRKEPRVTDAAPRTKGCFVEPADLRVHLDRLEMNNKLISPAFPQKNILYC